MWHCEDNAMTKTVKKIEREVFFQENREREEEMAMERINGIAKMKATSRRRKYREEIIMKNLSTKDREITKNLSTRDRKEQKG